MENIIYKEDESIRRLKRRKLIVKLIVCGVSILLVAITEALASDTFVVRIRNEG